MNGHLHSGWHDDSPTERLPVVGTRAKRNRLATTGIVLVLLAAVSTPFSATAPFGVLFAFAALFCAAIAVWRSREGRVPNRGRAMTALGGRRPMRRVQDRMQSNWLHFARHGTPADHWPAYDTDTRLTRIFAASDRVEADPRRERRLAWEGFRGYR